MEQAGSNCRHYQLGLAFRRVNGISWFIGLYLVVASWVCSSLAAVAAVDLLQYYWQVTTSTGKYTSQADPQPTAKRIVRYLKAAQTVKAEERDQGPVQTDSPSQSSTHPQSVPHSASHANLLHYLHRYHAQLTSLHLKGRAVIGPDAIAILGQFANLRSLTIIVPAGTSLALAGNLGSLGTLSRLTNLLLDFPQVQLAAAPIVFTDSALKTVGLRQQTFAQPIRFKHCCALARVDLRLPRLPELSLVFPHGEVLTHPVLLTVHTNALVHLPAVLLNNPQVYLDLRCDLNHELTLTEHTAVVGVALCPGADALLNLIASSITQHGTPIMCCTTEQFTSWAALDGHYTRVHSQQHRYLATYINHHRVAVPCPRPAPTARYTHYLTPAELQELAAFFSVAPVKAIKILKGQGTVELNLNAIHEQQPVLSLSDWRSILEHISLLHLASTSVAIPIPRCFYKLFTLSSLTIDDCWLPNLFETVAAMPGLRQLEISSSTFDYAGYLASDFFRQVRVHNPQKAVALINCQSEEDVKSGHLLVGMSLLAMLVVVIILYAISVLKMNRAQGQPLVINEQRFRLNPGPHLIHTK